MAYLLIGPTGLMKLYRKNKKGITEVKYLRNIVMVWSPLNSKLANRIKDLKRIPKFIVHELDSDIDKIQTTEDLKKYYPELVL